MATPDGKGKKPSAPSSHPPPSVPVDVSWDDDTVPRLDFDDPAFDRVTAIPELPAELFAKQLMEEALSGDSSGPHPTAGAKVPGPSPGSPVPFELEGALLSSTPPTTELPNSNRSTAPPPHRQRDELVLEIDDSALGPGGAIRDSGGLGGDKPRLSLELDLSGLDRERSIPPSSDPAMREISDRYATGDFSGALVLAEGILENKPDHAEALRYAGNCRDVLTQMYSARLGTLDQVVTIAIPSEQIRWLSLDHRSGFLLSLVDGTSSVEEVLDISGMPKLDALRILYTLREERVIALVPRGA